MASTSTSTSTSISDGSFLRYEPPTTRVAFKSDKRYHVFLSFRGTDVRNTFVDHLFEALSVAGLNVYKDDENLEKGEEIWPSLKIAIDSSAIRIPIFSDGYAQSDWCLREAAAMLDTPALIIPFFYHINPTHVRYPEKEPSPYSQSFQKHRSHSDRRPREEIEWWKQAFLQICPCLQSYSQSVRYKSEEIDLWKKALFEICKRSGWSKDITDGYEARIVKTVVTDLIRTLDRVPLQVAKHPVGLDNVKNALIQKLKVDSLDDVVKIGILGIGGIGKTTVAKAVYNKCYDDFEAASFLSNVRSTATQATGLTKLQKKVLKDLAKHDTEVDSVEEGIPLLRDRLGGKRVLLILDDVDAVAQLDALVGDWLVRGSRLIITSRDKHILNIAGVSSECIHEMSGLEMKESLELFSWHTFLSASPSLGYEELSRRIAEACKGHPLSLEVIGSFLYDKKDDTGCWKEALQIITHNSDIYKILYISYSALSDEEKEIFVDIACFFIGEDKTLPFVFWESLYKKVHTAISNLSMKLLIKFDDRGLFDMHDHLRDMGRTIAEKEKKGTRQWEHSHLSTVSNNLSCLRLIGGNPQSLEMLYTDDLRYLHLQNLTIECVTKDTLLILTPKLIWLRLENCSFEIGMNRGVNKRRHSRIVHNIWQCKIIQLINCEGLSSLSHRIGNLSQLQNLELWCESLSSLPDSIGKLSQLQKLNLLWCESLSSLPNNIGNLSQLQKLKLLCESLNSLPDSIVNLSQLQELDLFGCESLNSLPDSIGNLSQLQELDLSGCESLSSLPDSIGNLSQLKILELCGSLISLPNSIGNLSQLQELKLLCESLSNLPDTIGNLSKLEKLVLFRCCSLRSLPDSIGNLSQLQKLKILTCESLSSLPDSIGKLSQLQKLELRCESLSSLPDSIGNLLQLQKLELVFESLTDLPDSIGNLSKLQKLKLWCGNLSTLPDCIGNLSQLEELDLLGYRSLTSLPDCIGNLSQLQKLNLQNCVRLSSLPNSIGDLSQLKELDLSGCESLSNLPDSVSNLSQLRLLR